MEDQQDLSPRTRQQEGRRRGGLKTQAKRHGEDIDSQSGQQHHTEPFRDQAGRLHSPGGQFMKESGQQQQGQQQQQEGQQHTEPFRDKAGRLHSPGGQFMKESDI